MSSYPARSRKELLLWLDERIRELEEELEYLRNIRRELAGFTGDGEDPRRPRPGERVEEVRVGRRKIARLFSGENYVRLVPLEEIVLTRDIRDYLRMIVGELRSENARNGDPEDLPKLEIRGYNTVEEIVVYNLQSIHDIIKARAALRHAAEIAWHYTRAARNNGSKNGEKRE